MKELMKQTLDIIDIGTSGDGIAKMPDGRTVFVPLTTAGDHITAEIEKDGDILRGRLVSVEQGGPGRTTPPCRHFGICGGCSLQHINDATYKEFKKQSVISTLEKAGVSVPDNFSAIFIPPFTRRRANFAARVVNGKAHIGFHERKSSHIRNVPDCLLINEDVRAVMEAFRPLVPQLIHEGEKLDILIQCVDGNSEIGLTGKLAPGWEAQAALADALRVCNLARISLRARDYEAYELLLEAKVFYKRFDSLLVNLAPGAFLQPSDEGEVTLTKLVIDGADEAPRVADLFCGNGTFTGALMKDSKVIAIDSAEDAIDTLKKSGADARVRNLFKDPMSAKELRGVDCVILDPPRAGASAQVQELADNDIEKIVYVSCNPQSFAKDAAKLIEGGYMLNKLTLVDQFVWSTHTELVGVFTKEAW